MVKIDPGIPIISVISDRNQDREETIQIYLNEVLRYFGERVWNQVAFLKFLDDNYVHSIVNDVKHTYLNDKVNKYLNLTTNVSLIILGYRSLF